jgi:hypothetical protein
MECFTSYQASKPSTNQAKHIRSCYLVSVTNEGHPFLCTFFTCDMIGIEQFAMAGISISIIVTLQFFFFGWYVYLVIQ